MHLVLVQAINIAKDTPPVPVPVDRPALSGQTAL